MQVTFTHRAPGSVFAPNAFDSSIGKEIDVHLPDSPAATKGRLVAAKVAVDGSAVSLTVEVPDGTVTFPTTDRADFPFHEATLARVRREEQDDMCVCDHPRQLHESGGACSGTARHDYPNRCGCTAFELAPDLG